MIDLTPLDVRKKRGDFRKGLRGYETQEVDSFLELVAERLEELVRENMQLRERAHSLQEQTDAQSQREEAVRDALVTAQELRTEIREQARTEADRIIHQAQTEGRRLLAEAEAEVRTRLRNSERQADHAVATLGVLERRRLRFLQTFRQLLEREMDVVEVEEGRPALEERSFDLDFGSGVEKAASVAPPRGPEPEERASGWSFEDTADPEREPALDARLEDLVASDRVDEPQDPAAADGEEPSEGSGPAPRRNDNLLLYLEPEDDAEDQD